MTASYAFTCISFLMLRTQFYHEALIYSYSSINKIDSYGNLDYDWSCSS